MRGGVQLAEFNIDDSEITHLFQEHYKGPATETVPTFVETMLGKARL